MDILWLDILQYKIDNSKISSRIPCDFYKTYRYVYIYNNQSFSIMVDRCRQEIHVGFMIDDKLLIKKLCFSVNEYNDTLIRLIYDNIDVICDTLFNIIFNLITDPFE